jgi:hypothetical protein
MLERLQQGAQGGRPSNGRLQVGFVRGPQGAGGGDWTRKRLQQGLHSHHSGAREHARQCCCCQGGRPSNGRLQVGSEVKSMINVHEGSSGCWGGIGRVSVCSRACTATPTTVRRVSMPGSAAAAKEAGPAMDGFRWVVR